jgi:hypothetical protein
MEHVMQTYVFQLDPTQVRVTCENRERCRQILKDLAKLEPYYFSYRTIIHEVHNSQGYIQSHHVGQLVTIRGPVEGIAYGGLAQWMTAYGSVTFELEDGEVVRMEYVPLHSERGKAVSAPHMALKAACEEIRKTVRRRVGWRYVGIFDEGSAISNPLKASDLGSIS